MRWRKNKEIEKEECGESERETETDGQLDKKSEGRREGRQAFFYKMKRMHKKTLTFNRDKKIERINGKEI